MFPNVARRVEALNMFVVAPLVGVRLPDHLAESGIDGGGGGVPGYTEVKAVHTGKLEEDADERARGALEGGEAGHGGAGANGWSEAN